ncbi:unnamed protein product [Dovyalis caffra]|uniref:Uncharacterized protein n=1 Tax=Dovyalis caffra TaxID=77055 RepID=A0AAV1S515_9ROSI|nr:unnamed protein product [Dovyalis caffra]
MIPRLNCQVVTKDCLGTPLPKHVGPVPLGVVLCDSETSFFQSPSHNFEMGE